MIKPAQKDDALITDIQSARAATDELHIWWLGQSGFLIQHNHHHLLFDPYLSDSLTHKYASTDKPHVRMTDLVIDPARLDFVDVVTSTHNHTDHLDAETLLPLRQVNPDLKLVIPEANRIFVAERLNCDPHWPIGMNDGESLPVGPFQFHAVPAAHESIDRDDAGLCRFLGYVVEVGPFVIYHSGDTVMYPGMVERLQAFKIDIAILPINGRAAERRVSGNLWGTEAARLAYDIGARMVVPCHYDMFEFNTETPEAFVDACNRFGQQHRVLQCGERLNYSQSEGNSNGTA